MATQTTAINGVLFIGLVCEDIICSVSEYPKEDDKVRCSSSIVKTGGNARNSAVVLSLLNQTQNEKQSKDNNHKNEKINIYFMGSLSNKERSAFVVSDLNKYDINTDFCIYSDQHDMTVSYIIVSDLTKSRTIINNPCLKPLTFEDFMQIIDKDTNHTIDRLSSRYNNAHNDDMKIDIVSSNTNCKLLNTINNALKFINSYSFIQGNKCILDGISVIHIDARWMRSMIQILSFIKKYYPKIFISIEIEKERLYDNDDGSLISQQTECYPVNDLIPFADLVFFSKQLIINRGYKDNPKQFIQDIIKKYGNNRSHPLTIIVGWGEIGAFGIKYDCSLNLYNNKHHNHNIIDDIHFIKAYPPNNGVVDTIGAGDTFIGSYLNYAINIACDVWKYDIEKGLDYACQVAGFKVGYQGFDCIKEFMIN